MEEQNRKQNQLRIELTDEQKRQIKTATGKDVAAVEFNAQELEERVAPASFVLF
jgi:hypothetical protein